MDEDGMITALQHQWPSSAFLASLVQLSPWSCSCPQRQPLPDTDLQQHKPFGNKLSATWRSSFHGEGKCFHGSNLWVQVQGSGFGSPGHCPATSLQPPPFSMLTSGYPAVHKDQLLPFPHSPGMADKPPGSSLCSQGRATTSGGMERLERIQGSKGDGD